MIANLCTSIIIGTIALGLVAVALPFVMAAGEWVWDSWRNR